MAPPAVRTPHSGPKSRGTHGHMLVKNQQHQSLYLPAGDDNLWLRSLCFVSESYFVRAEFGGLRLPGRDAGMLFLSEDGSAG